MDKKTMCHDIATSLATWLFSNAIALHTLLSGADRFRVWLAVFVIVFSSMQLVDAALWFSLTHGLSGLNMILSARVIPILLGLQTMVSYYGGVWASGMRLKWVEPVLWLYALFLLPFTWSCTAPTKTTAAGYLRWCDFDIHPANKVFFFSTLLLPFVLFYPTGWAKTLLLGVGLATFVVNFRLKEFGSRWCWMANMLALFLWF